VLAKYSNGWEGLPFDSALDADSFNHQARQSVAYDEYTAAKKRLDSAVLA